MRARKLKLLRPSATPNQGTGRRFSSTFRKLALPLAWCALIAMGIPLIVAGVNRRKADDLAAAAQYNLRSLEQLLAMPPERLARVDIARMNLLCATGLPGAEDMDIEKCLTTLDRWAERVKAETERHLYRLTAPAYKEHADHYKNSEARFRAEWLVTVLQQDIGLHYHVGFMPPDKPVVPPKTSKEHFIHGLMDNEDAHKAFGGNCVSLPVAYVAVGRRLGYPVKLVTAKEHVFCRWEGTDDPNPAWRDRFNFDGAGAGFSIDPDEFYLSWPRKSTAEQIELSDWLKSLTPQQELALFIGHRGHVLAKLCGDASGAMVAFAQSARLWPTNRGPLQNAQEMIDKLWATEIASHSETYRRLYGVQVVDGRVAPIRTAFASESAVDPIMEAQRINEINRQNMERTASAYPGPGPLSPAGVPQPRGPAVYRPPAPGAPQPRVPSGGRPGIPHPYLPTYPGQQPGE